MLSSEDELFCLQEDTELGEELKELGYTVGGEAPVWDKIRDADDAVLVARARSKDAMQALRQCRSRHETYAVLLPLEAVGQQGFKLLAEETSTPTTIFPNWDDGADQPRERI